MENDTTGSLLKTSSSGHVRIVEDPGEEGKHEHENKRLKRDGSDDRSGTPVDSDAESLYEREEAAKKNARVYDIDSIDADVAELYLEHGRIETVPEQLPRFTQMNSLVLRQNLLTQITNLTSPVLAANLTQLELYDNQITKIEGLDALVNLEHLDLSYNRLRKIENLHALKNLRILYFVHNKIRKIEGLEHNVKLELLELGDNRVRVLENVSHLTQLRQLFIGKNKIREIQNIDELKSLKCLSMPGNRLTKITNLDKLTQLEELYLSDNGLTEISGIEKLTDLVMLDVANNQISSLGNLSPLQNLEDFWANDNDVSDWHEIDRALAPLKQLRTVYMERNPIYYQDTASYRRKMILALPQATQIDALMTNASTK